MTSRRLSASCWQTLFDLGIVILPWNSLTRIIPRRLYLSPVWRHPNLCCSFMFYMNRNLEQRPWHSEINLGEWNTSQWILLYLLLWSICSSIDTWQLRIARDSSQWWRGICHQEKCCRCRVDVWRKMAVVLARERHPYTMYHLHHRPQEENGINLFIVMRCPVVLT